MKIKLKPLDQQVVVVFGASSGIGRETALRFARKGATVVVVARGGDGLETLVEEIQRSGGTAMAIVADALSFEQVKAVADLTAEQYGRLDTWVHAAAVSVYAPFTQTTPQEFAQVVEVNLIGQAYGAMAALPYLRKNGGALIHISSIEAKQPLPLHSAYAASKHGVHGFVETMRMELAHDQERVSVTEILPASINTPFFNHARTKIGVKPMGAPPLYEPAIVADAILYAATHPVRQIVVGGAGKTIVASQRMSARMTSAVFARIGFAIQETKEPKSEGAPNDLYAPTTGDNRAQGDFSSLSRSHSTYTWLRTYRLVRTVLVGAALVGAAVLARRKGSTHADDTDEASQMEVADLEIVQMGTVDRVVVIPTADLPDESALPAETNMGSGSAVELAAPNPAAATEIILDRPTPTPVHPG